MIYTFGDSVLDSTRYSGVTAGEIVSRTLGQPLKHYAADGATSNDLERQWFKAIAERTSDGIAMVSIGGNDLIHYNGIIDEYERMRFSGRLCYLLNGLRADGITPYVANIYDPTFGSNEQDFLGISEREAARASYNKMNEVIEEAASLGVFVDLRQHFLQGDPSWFAFDIEPSQKGAEEVAKAFLEKINASV